MCYVGTETDEYVFTHTICSIICIFILILHNYLSIHPSSYSLCTQWCYLEGEDAKSTPEPPLLLETCYSD